MTEELIYVGIDVAKDRVDVATRPADQHWSVSYDAAGVEALVAKLQVLEPAAVILEATGGLELPLVAAVARQRYPLRWSIPAKYEISPGPPANSPRPTSWTLASWPTSGRRSVLRYARCAMPTPRSSGPCWPVAARWSPSWWQKKTG